MSSILYPSGMRAVLRASFAHSPDDFVVADTDRTVTGYHELTLLNNDMARFAELATTRQAQVLSCLNCLTEQRLAVRLARHLTGDYYSDAGGCSALYEAARALMRLRPHDRLSRTVLSRLSQQSANRWIAVAAAIQLGAASIRIDRDLVQADAALQTAERSRAELDGEQYNFIATLFNSRYFRLQALLAAIRHAFPLVTDALAHALATAETLVADTAGDVPYLQLVAGENLKIVLEAHLKAASAANDPAAFARWAIRLVEVDPEDSHTWRYVATYGAACGLTADAALAMSGLTAIGGLGVPEVLGALRTAPRNDVRSPELTEVLLAALAALHRPETPPAIGARLAESVYPGS